MSARSRNNLQFGNDFRLNDIPERADLSALFGCEGVGYFEAQS